MARVMLSLMCRMLVSCVRLLVSSRWLLFAVSQVLSTQMLMHFNAFEQHSCLQHHIDQQRAQALQTGESEACLN